MDGWTDGWMDGWMDGWVANAWSCLDPFGLHHSMVSQSQTLGPSHRLQLLQVAPIAREQRVLLLPTWGAQGGGSQTGLQGRAVESRLTHRVY